MLMLTSEEVLDNVQRAIATYHDVAELQDYHRLDFACTTRTRSSARSKETLSRTSRIPQT